MIDVFLHSGGYAIYEKKQKQKQRHVYESIKNTGLYPAPFKSMEVCY